MQKLIEFLEGNPVQYFATIGLDNKPKVRPFQFMLEDGGKLYFVTSNKKDVFKELESCPYVEVSATSPNYEWLRMSAQVVFSNSLEVKEKVLEKSQLVKSIYQTANNPELELFYLSDVSATKYDFSGNPPQKLI